MEGHLQQGSMCSRGVHDWSWRVEVEWSSQLSVVEEGATQGQETECIVDGRGKRDGTRTYSYTVTKFQVFCPYNIITTRIIAIFSLSKSYMSTVGLVCVTSRLQTGTADSASPTDLRCRIYATDRWILTITHSTLLFYHALLFQIHKKCQKTLRAALNAQYCACAANPPEPPIWNRLMHQFQQPSGRFS